MSSVDRLVELLDAEILYNRNNVVGGRWSSELHEARQIAAALREQPEARGVVDDAMVERACAEFARHGRANFRWSDEGMREVVRAVLTAAQQPVQEGGGEVVGVGVWTDHEVHGDTLRCSIKALRGAGFGVLAGQLELARDFYTAPPSAPVGVEDATTVLVPLDALTKAATALTFADCYDEAAELLSFATTVTQQPAQAAPGDGIGWRWKYEDRRALVSHWHAEAVRLGYDGVADLLACVEKGEPPTHIADVLARVATPPGDDAAGGGA